MKDIIFNVSLIFNILLSIITVYNYYIKYKSDKIAKHGQKVEKTLEALLNFERIIERSKNFKNIINYRATPDFDGFFKANEKSFLQVIQEYENFATKLNKEIYDYDTVCEKIGDYFVSEYNAYNSFFTDPLYSYYNNFPNLLNLISKMK